MTISDAHVGEANPAADVNDAVPEALQQVLFGDHMKLHAWVRDVLTGLDDLPRPGSTHAAEAERAPTLLQEALAGLGASASTIASDAQFRGAFCDWAQILTPRLLLILTGQLDLSTGAILSLGNGSEYQQQCLAELDTGAAGGVLILTELAGTNGNDHQTTATWDPRSGGFWLKSPTRGSCKFMPNVADPSVPKICTVTARLVVEGRDEGVLPFLLRLRTSEGLAEGAKVFRLPDKSSAAMDHALIRFENVWVPREALLGGTWARMNEDGRLECDVPIGARFHKSINVLSQGRLDLANAANASARAALSGLVNYAPQRKSGSGTAMSDRDNVGQDLVRALAATYATGVLGRRIRDLLAYDTGRPEHVVWAMLAKPLLSYTAHDVLKVCRWRAASQGILRNNRIVDWIGNVEAIITAEGENQILQISAGNLGVDLNALELPETPDNLPWYIDLLSQRARVIADGLANRDYLVAGPVMGKNSAVIELTTTTAERLAATALVSAAQDVEDPTAKSLVMLLAEAYALDRIHDHGLWYVTRGIMTTEHAEKVEKRLHHTRSSLRTVMPVLTEAFQIPPLPDAPLFAPDYIEAWTDIVRREDPTFFGSR